MCSSDLLIPIFLGLKVLLLGDSDGEAIAKEGLRKDNKNLIFLVAMITFASCGADNIGVFVPYFTTLNLANLIVALLTFLVMIYLLVFSEMCIRDRCQTRRTTGVNVSWLKKEIDCYC